MIPTIDLITVSDIWSTTIQDRLLYHNTDSQTNRQTDRHTDRHTRGKKRFSDLKEEVSVYSALGE